MAKKEKPAKIFWNVIMWLTAIIIALVFGFAMIFGTLSLTMIGLPLLVTQIAGWIVVGLTAIGIIGKIANWF